jgi:hypothetical protein
MPRAEPRRRPGPEALEYGDIPGVPTANWGTGESCVESELKKSRIPLGCVAFIAVVVLLGSVDGGNDEDVQSAPAGPTPTPNPAPEPAPAPSPDVEPPTPARSSFPSCKGLRMDCNGAETCGVVVLETGKGAGYYKHTQPSVHGLWPQSKPPGLSVSDFYQVHSFSVCSRFVAPDGKLRHKRMHPRAGSGCGPRLPSSLLQQRRSKGRPSPSTGFREARVAKAWQLQWCA